MPRKQAATTINGQQKPALSHRVEWRNLGDTRLLELLFSNPTSAVKWATDMFKSGASDVAIESYGNDGFEYDKQLTEQARAKVKGVKNVMAVITLTQLGEYNAQLVKQANSTNGFQDEQVRSWLEQFFAASKAMGVTPQAMQSMFDATFQAEPQNTPA